MNTAAAASTPLLLNDLDAAVQVVLDRTAFFPTGGGVLGDRGVLVSPAGTFPVIETVEAEGEILHRREGAVPAVGEPVAGDPFEGVDDSKMEAFMAEIPDAPSIYELAKTEAQKQFMRFVFSTTEYGRPYVLPPDVPAERVAILRKAFDATMLDKAFLEEAEKQALDIRPMKGDVLEKIVQEAVKTPPDILEKVRKIIGLRTKREFGIGDRLRVCLDRVDEAEKRLQFSLVEPEQRVRRKAGKGKNKRK